MWDVHTYPKYLICNVLHKICMKRNDVAVMSFKGALKWFEDSVWSNNHDYLVRSNKIKEVL